LVKTNSKHAREHALERAPKWIRLVCPECKEVFFKQPAKFRYQTRKGHTIFCSRVCVGKAAQRSSVSQRAEYREKPPHGTLVRYNYHKCRCDACRRASREYTRQRRI
jgi:hypothetical protein